MNKKEMAHASKKPMGEYTTFADDRTCRMQIADTIKIMPPATNGISKPNAGARAENMRER